MRSTRWCRGPLRARHPDGHQHYDALLNPEAIRSELRGRTGFEIVSMQGIQYRYSRLQALQVYVARGRRAWRDWRSTGATGWAASRWSGW